MESADELNLTITLKPFPLTTFLLALNINSILIRVYALTFPTHLLTFCFFLILNAPPPSNPPFLLYLLEFIKPSESLSKAEP